MRAGEKRKRASRLCSVAVHCVWAFVLALSHATAAEIRLSDDAGRRVTLQQPAQRIISLAPHLTELLFAAGAGGKIVGTVAYSNYPVEARSIARIGDSAQLDLERIVALKPDLVLVWRDGNAQRQLDKLLHLGIPVFYNEPRRLPDIARAIEEFGLLAGTEAVARPAARAFMARLDELRVRYAGRAPVSVFYQIWDKPLMSVNGEHLISDVIRLCGGRNIFAALKSLTPEIATEAVLAADPEAIVGVGAEAGQAGNLDAWKHWPRLRAVARGNLFLIDSDLISRNSPRILDGAGQMCEQLDTARTRRR
ncbi:MAG: cobalamin-binding protein [Burkholderiales bacterium]|jgi:iron complex transport system substrate-binding protein